MKKLLLGLSCALFISPALAEISVTAPQVRAVPAGQKVTAAFMSVENTGLEDLSIVSADSDIAEVVELHTHLKEGDKMMMRKIDTIPLPSSSVTKLQPGGLHIMLIGLEEPLSIDQVVEIELSLSNGDSLTVEAPVKKIMPMMQGMKHGMHKK